MKLGKRLRDEYERVYRPSSDYEAFCQDSGISAQKKDKKPGYFNPIRVGRYVLTAVSCLLVAVIVIPIGAFLIASIRIKDSVRSNEARFSLQEVELAQSKTFRALNEIEYREDNGYQKVSPSFVSHTLSLGEDLFFGLDPKENTVFSPLSAYAALDLASLAVTVGDETTAAQFDALLGEKEERESEVAKALRNNFYVSKGGERGESTVQMRQAAFVDARLGAAPTFVEEATSRRAEVYEADFTSSTDKAMMASWGSKALGQEGFVSPGELGLNEDSTLLILSSLYFQSRWEKAYSPDDTLERPFYRLDGSSVMTDFMNHEILSDYYEYEDYVSFYDYYESGYAIEYFVPKTQDGDIKQILSGKDFLTPSVEKTSRMVDLYVPRFSYDSLLDFTDVLKGLGLENAFDAESNHMAGCYEEEGVVQSALTSFRQKNRIALNEDGTTAHSLTFVPAFGALAPAPGDLVYLNQPFVYCLRDLDGLPLFLGYVSDPS